MNTVIIMRGISGAGKTTWHRTNFPNALVCSADHYQVNDVGKYEFKPERASDAHLSCFAEYYWGLHTRKPIIVVDNTNTQAWEISPYLSLAALYGDSVRIIRIECPIEVAIQRTTHGTPEGTIRRMYNNLQQPLPRHWPKEEIITNAN